MLKINTFIFKKNMVNLSQLCHLFVYKADKMQQGTYQSKGPSKKLFTHSLTHVILII
jgi:hypothetical protein